MTCSAVQIDFRSPYGPKRLIYVSADLSNSGFTPSFKSWLDQFSGATAYFKAASYLPHDARFSEIRSWVLNNTRAVLQDDSGIPYKYYDPQIWNVALLGNYQAPIPLFAKHRQANLAAAYAARGPAAPIPFGSGYHLRRSEANYQVATRR